MEISGIDAPTIPKKRDNGAVTPKQFFDWLQNNLNYTWYHGEGGGIKALGTTKKGNPIFKYFYLSLDTRTMEIFHVDTNVGSVDFRDTFAGVENVIDLLNARIDGISLPANTDLERALTSKFPDLEYAKVKKALTFILQNCIDQLFKEKGGDKQQFSFDKTQFTYHEMREKFEEIIRSL